MTDAPPPSLADWHLLFDAVCVRMLGALAAQAAAPALPTAHGSLLECVQDLRRLQALLRAATAPAQATPMAQAAPPAPFNPAVAPAPAPTPR